MDKFKKYLFAASSLVLLAGCSEDVIDSAGDNSGGNESNAPGVYIGVHFQMPGMGGTRSTTTPPVDDESTSSSGIEIGKDYENNVNEVLLILARKDDYGLISAAKVLKDNIYKHTGSGVNAGAYHATAKFEKSALDVYYQDQKNFDPEIAVFVVVNPTIGMEDYINALPTLYGDTGWINQPWTVTAGQGQTEGSIWSTTNGGNFLMTNSRMAYRSIPASADIWDLFSSKDTPFNLSAANDLPGTDNDIDNSIEGRGPVNVHRAAARFDFKDGSPESTPANTYHVVFLKDNDGNDTEQPVIDVEMQKMALVNMNNKFHYFQRVSADGLPAGAKICSPELPWYASVDPSKPLLDPKGGNYVVDFYADQKKAGISTGFSQYFNYPFFEDDGSLNNANLSSADRWGSVLIKDVLAGKEMDNYLDKHEYHIWRYTTENTIPEINTPSPYYQANGISTGIVFKAKMRANEELLVADATDKNDIRRNELIKAINDPSPALGDSWKAPILYSYAGQLYATWPSLREAAIEASMIIVKENGEYVPDWNRTNSLYMAVFGRGITGETITRVVDGKEITITDTEGDIDPTSANYAWNAWDKAQRPGAGDQLTVDFKKAVTNAGITIYQRSEDKEDGWGYYCYYYYWNRHNDNNRNGIMGPMEFATVRNNVYKLAVTKISRLGHPRMSDNDPDSPDPGTPDESSDAYITVDSKVIPWVVRINNIEF